MIQLGDLPPRVLTSIFAFSASTTQPISKALLPFTQRNLYRAVNIRNGHRLGQFCTALRRNSTLSHLVTTLSINFEGASEDPGIPSDCTLDQLFQQLVELELEVLEVGGPGSHRRPLRSRRARTSLRKHSKLSISGSFEGWRTPFDYSRYRHLALYPALEELEIADVEVIDWDELGSYFAGADLERAENYNIDSLRLEGRLSSPAAIDLVSRFPCLIYLDLVDLSPESNLVPLLEAVDEEIASLSVELQTEDFVPLDDVLARFTSLDRIVFFSDVPPFTDAVFDTLTRLPLTEASFMCGEVPPAKVLELVGNLTTLESLDVFRWAEQRQSILHWQLPAWSESFDLAGARNLVKAAEDAGVEMGEGLLNALAVEDAFAEALRGGAAPLEAVVGLFVGLFNSAAHLQNPGLLTLFVG